MVEEIFFQNWIFTKFIFPFVLIWTIVFALLGKTKLLGENRQVDSIVAFFIAFIFVVALKPKEIVNNLILFLTVALIVMFVILLLWGFVSGSKEVSIGSKGLKWVIGIVIVIAVIIAFLWASGIHNNMLNLLFKSNWSNTFWTNAIFIVVIAIALALALRKSG